MDFYRPSAEGYREREWDYVRNGDVENDRDHIRARDRDRDGERDFDRSRRKDRTRDKRSRSRSTERSRFRDRDKQRRVSAPQHSGIETPNDPRPGAKDPIYQTTTKRPTLPHKPVLPDRIMIDVSAEKAESPEAKLATLMKQLGQAAVEERMYRACAEDTQKILERHKKDRRRLASSVDGQFSGIAGLHDRTIAEKQASLDQAESQAQRVEKRVRNLTDVISDELVKLRTPRTSIDTPSTPKFPANFEARFEALEKAVSQEKKARAEEKKAVAEAMKAKDERLASLEITNKSLEEAAKSHEKQTQVLEKKSISLEKNNISLQERVKQEEKERSRLKIQLQSVEKLVKGNHDETHRVKKEIDDQHAQMAVLRDMFKGEASGGSQNAATQRLDNVEKKVDTMVLQLESEAKNLSEINIPALRETVALFSGVSNDEMASIKKMATSTEALGHVEMASIRQDVKGLRDFDNKMIDMFGDMIDKLRQRMEKLEERDTPIERAGSSQNQPGELGLVRSDLEKLSRKVIVHEEKLQTVSPPPAETADIGSIKAKVEEVAEMVNRMHLRVDAHEFEIASLDNRWSNINTKEFAEVVLGYMEKVYPTAQQLEQSVKDISSRLARIETRVQQGEAVPPGEKKRKFYNGMDQGC